MWQPTKIRVSNQELHTETGTYHGRVKLGGNTVRRALGSIKAPAIGAKDKKLEGSARQRHARVRSIVEKYFA